MRTDDPADTIAWLVGEGTAGMHTANGHGAAKGHAPSVPSEHGECREHRAEVRRYRCRHRRPSRCAGETCSTTGMEQ